MNAAQEKTYDVLHTIGWELIPSEDEIKIILPFTKGQGTILEDGTAKLNYDRENHSNMDLDVLCDYGG